MRVSGAPSWAVVAALLLGATLLYTTEAGRLLREGGWVNVSAGGQGSEMLRAGPARSERITQRIAGTRTGEVRRSFWAPAGSQLGLTYATRVARGRLHLSVLETGPGRRDVWSTSVERDARDETAASLERGGNYDVVIRMTAFGGEFDVRWVVR